MGLEIETNIVQLIVASFAVDIETRIRPRERAQELRVDGDADERSEKRGRSFTRRPHFTGTRSKGLE